MSAVGSIPTSEESQLAASELKHSYIDPLATVILAEALLLYRLWPCSASVSA